MGAGVAGLFLVILLERARILYQVYERAKGVKRLGKQTALVCASNTYGRFPAKSSSIHSTLSYFFLAYRSPLCP